MIKKIIFIIIILPLIWSNLILSRLEMDRLHNSKILNPNPNDISKSNALKKEMLNKALGLSYFGFSALTIVVALSKIYDAIFDINNHYRSGKDIFKKLLTGTFTDLCTARALYFVAKELYVVKSLEEAHVKEKEDLFINVRNCIKGFLDKFLISYGATSYIFDYKKQFSWTVKNNELCSEKDKKCLAAGAFITPGLIYALYKVMIMKN